MIEIDRNEKIKKTKFQKKHADRTKGWTLKKGPTVPKHIFRARETFFFTFVTKRFPYYLKVCGCLRSKSQGGVLQSCYTVLTSLFDRVRQKIPKFRNFGNYRSSEHNKINKEEYSNRLRKVLQPRFITATTHKKIKKFKPNTHLSLENTKYR